MTLALSCRRALILSCVLLAGLSALAGDEPPSSDRSLNGVQLTGAQVGERLAQSNAERALALEQYQGRRVYSLDYVGFFGHHHAEMTVDMNYSAPKSKHFTIVSQSGSKWVISHIFKRLLSAEQEALEKENQEKSALNGQNYAFTLLNLERTPACNCYLLQVEPKQPSKFLYRGRIWVDAQDFAVRRIEAEPAKNPSFWIKNTAIQHNYQKIGGFWLPAEDHTVSTLRLGGRALLQIQYQDYRILAARPLQRAIAASP